MKKPLFLIFQILFLDQASKFWVKTHMTIGQEIKVIGNWFRIHFTENPGMAFGMELSGENGKLVLTLFRIIAAILIFIYLYRLTKKDSHPLLLISISMILAGAIGNIIDSMFYGVLFNESTFYEPAKLLSAEEGYAPLFHGHVVDMLYFPILKGQYPSWVPLLGSKEFIFFRPVFNLADSSITIGVFILILCQSKCYKSKDKESIPAQSDIPEETDNPETFETRILSDNEQV
ncbi:MAG: lipoprotein signal peptidase [Bacteroidales bacterium]|nr:lipoprotein signal peptidase [Bacteroidales bacterium]